MALKGYFFRQICVVNYSLHLTEFGISINIPALFSQEATTEDENS